MHFSSVLIACTAITAVTAAPGFGWPSLPSLPLLPGLGLPGCLDDYGAKTYVDNFIKTLKISGNDTAAFATAISAVANPGVQEISDSSDYLAGKPYGSVTLDGIGAFEGFHATSPPGGIYQVTTLNIWHGCNSITWRWLFILYPGAQPIRGINVFELGKNGKADKIYIEYNDVAWAENLGYTCAPPAGPPPS